MALQHFVPGQILHANVDPNGYPTLNALVDAINAFLANGGTGTGGTGGTGGGTGAATSYTLTGPGTGTVGSVSTFTLTAVGTLTTATSVVISASPGGGTPVTRTVILPAGTNTSIAGTLIPTAPGQWTVSATNTGGLTNPLSLAWAVAAAAPTGPMLYVSPSGSDSNPGTSTSRLKTISRADALATPGTTVMVADGSYAGGLTFSTDGSSGNPITYQAENRRGVKIQGGVTSADGSVIAVFARYVVIDGFDATGSDDAYSVWLIGADHVTLKNCDGHDIQRAAPLVWGAAFVVDRTYSKGGDFCTFDSCRAWNVGPASNRSNDVVHGFYQAAYDTTHINCLSYAVCGSAFTSWHYATRGKWINCTASDAHQGLTVGAGDNGGSVSHSGAVVRNCIFANIQGTGADEEGSTGTNTIDHNDYYSNTTNYHWLTSTETARLTSNPGFVSATDFHLRSGSAMVGAGSTTGAPTLDADGNFRGSAIDIGAFEYAADAGGGSESANNTVLSTVDSGYLTDKAGNHIGLHASGTSDGTVPTINGTVDPHMRMVNYLLYQNTGRVFAYQNQSPGLNNQWYYRLSMTLSDYWQPWGGDPRTNSTGESNQGDFASATAGTTFLVDAIGNFYALGDAGGGHLRLQTNSHTATSGPYITQILWWNLAGHHQVFAQCEDGSWITQDSPTSAPYAVAGDPRSTSGSGTSGTGVALGSGSSGNLVRAFDFWKFVTLQIHVEDGYNNIYHTTSRLEAALGWLNPSGVQNGGIYVLRQGTAGGITSTLSHFASLGYRFLLYLAYDPGTIPWNQNGRYDLIEAMRAAGALAFAEGELEVDQFGFSGSTYIAKDGNSYSGGRGACQSQIDLWTTCHTMTDCWGGTLKIIGPSHGTGASQSTSSYGAAAIAAGINLSLYMNFTTVHAYENWGWSFWAPGGSYGGSPQLAAEADNETNMYPTLKRFGTELGIQHDLGRAGDKWGTRVSQAAGYVQMVMGAWAKRNDSGGWAGVTIYEAGDRNQSGNATVSAPGNSYEDVWGLFDAYGQAYLSAVMWRWIGGLMADSGSTKATFYTGNLSWSVSGLPSGGSIAGFQTSTGKVILIIVDQQPLIGNSGGSYSGDLATPSASVTLTLSQSVGHMTAYAFMAPGASYTGSNMSSCPAIPPAGNSVTSSSSITFSLSSVAAIVIDA